ncbi:hypothetical protein SAMN05421805_101167 [Saccharopolyspora antimicrobica]|uniref:Uncharacterized protein n=1 Tax=Saccharopolyspora antimicrobica TaxID=455193 RepID=A0A1I4QL67_9PSEU|nr:histidine kinase [Saccharopolyspora antimicrobica]RKT88392.1 hypothetical protein ATL45_6826 [Saccharopolyspora antimicrobica]SFM40774.1 hypothetical protein SAMN05421805_101167 [Saccharopolyspora antimicrobica]
MSTALFVASMIAFAGAVILAALRFFAPRNDKGYALPGILFLSYAVLFAAWVVIA